MPLNKLALIRLKTIDKCLQNRRRRWTINDLIAACSDALYEYEGNDKEVSLRTIRNDIALLRSDKLGYNAPIEIFEKKYYRYEDPEYSITNIPLSPQDMDTLTEVVQILKQFKGFSHFNDLSSMVSKLEDKVYTERTHQQAIIDFEKNEHLTGLEHLDTVYQAIQNRTVLSLRYQSFRAKKPTLLYFHPWLLKEFRNRWFMIGIINSKRTIMTFALDRIQTVELAPAIHYMRNEDFNAKTYYQHVIGVTVNRITPQEIRIWVNNEHGPYVLSKPLHASQQLLEEREDGIVIAITVSPNFELEKDILAFGEGMEVLSPPNIRQQMAERTRKAADRYSS